MKLSHLVPVAVLGGLAAAHDPFFRFYSNPYCDGDKRSKQLPMYDSKCRDHGHRSSVWFFFRHQKKAKDKTKYCFLTYDKHKCGEEEKNDKEKCPFRALDVNEWLEDKPLAWELEKDDKYWYTYRPLNDTFRYSDNPARRCLFKLKANQIDKENDIWERSYRVAQSTCDEYFKNGGGKGCSWNKKKMSTNEWYKNQWYKENENGAYKDTGKSVLDTD